MRAAELFVHCLENEGVGCVFGLPGEENMHVLDALADSPIRFISVRHEQGAAFMANVYGRLTGRAGVCLATLGPGATNLTTGIADAFLDRAPLVAITGQTELRLVHKESHQFIDVVGSFAQITKWNTRVELPEVIPEVVRKAFKLAQTEKPGPTHIELPEDVAASEIGQRGGRVPAPLPATDAALAEPHPVSLAQAVRLLGGSTHPILLAGNGVIRQRASGALRRLVEKLNLPVATTFMGKGCVSWDDPRNLSSVGLQAGDYANFAIDRADLVLAVGYDMIEYAPELWNPRADKTILHIDTAPAEIDTHYQPAIELVGDLELALLRLADGVDREFRGDHVAGLRKMVLDQSAAYGEDNSYPVKPQRLMHTLRRVMDRDDILISDVGAHKLWVARLFPAYEPNTVIISNGFAAMGIAVPGAIAAKIARPQQRVVAVAGDGGFLMSCHELETAVRLETPMVVVVVNDNGYGMIRWKQERDFGRTFGVDLGNPDFARLAESFGCRGMRVDSTEQLEDTMRQALAAEAPVVVEVPIDYSENRKLSEPLGPPAPAM